MSTVSEITSQTASLAASTSGSAGVLGKDDFLKLLVAQLENQDPLNPADPTEFTAQLAQFSSLEQLFTVNETLARLDSSKEELQGLSALSLIDREITAKSEDFTYSEGSVDVGYNLEEAADKVTVYVQDEFGRTVTTLPAQALGPGDHFLTWDGKNDSGMNMPPGNYSVIVNAIRGENETVIAQSLVRGVVTGVDLAENGNILITSAGDFKQDSIRSVTGQKE